MTGLACYIAQSTKVDKFTNVNNMLARALTYADAQRVLVEQLNIEAEVSPWGTYMAPQRALSRRISFCGVVV